MLIPTGFWSYTTSDDANSRGKLSQLRALLAAELQQQVGRDPKVNIFQDVAAIPPGAEWERQIEEAIEKASFLIPIVTPGFVQSEWCCREVSLFRAREERLGVRNLIFPIHYVDTKHLDENDALQCRDPAVFAFLRTRQWIDFRHLRLRSQEGEAVSLLLESIANGVLKALREAGLEQQRAEQQRRRREEQVRKSAEVQRREETAREARLAAEHREREAERRQEAAEAETEARRRKSEVKASEVSERHHPREATLITRLARPVSNRMLAIGGTAIMVISLCVAGVIRFAEYDAKPLPLEVTSGSAIEDAIGSVPEYARYFARLRSVFPSDYESFLGKLNASNRGRDINPDQLMADAVAMLRHAHGMLAVKAPDDALARIFTRQLEEMNSLAKYNAHLCVAFLYGAGVPGFLAFSAKHRPLVAEAAMAGLDAINAGRINPVDRGNATDADFQTLDQAMVAKGLSRPEIDALLDGKAPTPPIDDSTMCEAGQTYLATLASLRPDTRDRLYALAVGLMAKQ